MSTMDPRTGLVLADGAPSPADTRRPWNVGAATGVGSLPGTSADEAARIVAGELPDLPFLPELPGRGVGSDLIGRAVGLLVDVAAEVLPSGWRITSRPGRDVRRANDARSFDLDAAAEQFAGAPWLKVQICGPWTLAAGLELSNGNRALIDPGAVRDLADSLAEGMTALLDDLTARLPGTALVVQVDEPSLPAVLAGALRTPSGFGTVRAVDPLTAGPVLQRFRSSFGDRPVVAHCCHPKIPVTLLCNAGFDGISLDLSTVGTAAARLDPLGEALEAGTVLLAGIVPSVRPTGKTPDLVTVARPLLDLWSHLGQDWADLPAVVPTPTCGLAGADPSWAVEALTMSADLARAFQDPPEAWKPSR